MTLSVYSLLKFMDAGGLVRLLEKTLEGFVGGIVRKQARLFLHGAGTIGLILPGKLILV